MIDCDSGICLGNSFKPPDVAYHCTGVVVRNNFVTRAPENGILADFTRDCAILHNTVHDPDSRHGRLIRLVHDNDGLRVETAAFVAADEGNLRLTAAATAAIDRAEPLAEVPADIDRTPRDAHPDLGAHEFVAAGESSPAGTRSPR